MKMLLGVGIVVLILGIVSFFVPVPHRENHGIKVGDASIDIQTQHDEKVPPAISGVLVLGGVLIMIAGGRGKA
jgi:hypothetical protein